MDQNEIIFFVFDWQAFFPWERIIIISLLHDSILGLIDFFLPAS